MGIVRKPFLHLTLHLKFLDVNIIAYSLAFEGDIDLAQRSQCPSQPTATLAVAAHPDFPSRRDLADSGSNPCVA